MGAMKKRANTAGHVTGSFRVALPYSNVGSQSGVSSLYLLPLTRTILTPPSQMLQSRLISSLFHSPASAVAVKQAFQSRMLDCFAQRFEAFLTSTTLGEHTTSESPMCFEDRTRHKNRCHTRQGFTAQAARISRKRPCQFGLCGKRGTRRTLSTHAGVRPLKR
eukprot:6949358-Pyramimonas_sp.AAC.1